MEYDLSETKRFSVDCSGCDATTGNDDRSETVIKRAISQGFVAISTPDDGTINLCVNCIPESVVEILRNLGDPATTGSGFVPGDIKAPAKLKA